MVQLYNLSDEGMVDADCACCKNRPDCTCADLWGICDDWEEVPEYIKQAPSNTY